MTLAFLLWLAAQPASGAIRGAIVDARDGTPLEKVSVRIQDTRQTTVSGEDGTFRLDAVPPGRHELYVSSVDYVLVRREVEVAAGEVLDLTIAISAGTGTYTETVNVSGTAGDEGHGGTIDVLRSNELQQLRGIITNDPMRAIHVLPGVATGDDLRSEFSVRGLPVAHMNFTFEGVATPLLVHTVQGVNDSGSIAMVNGDVLEEIALAAGSYPQRQGGRTGAELDFVMREGSRQRLRGLVRPSVTDTSMVLEGPLTRSAKGSWLVSLRKSYLGSVIRRIDPESTFGFGFHDTQVKLAYDVTAANQVQFAITAGRSRLSQPPGAVGTFDVKAAVNDVGVAVLTWRSVVSPRLLLTHKIAADGNTFRNTNPDAIELDRGRRDDLMYRADWSYSASGTLMIEGGGEVRRASASRFEIGRALVRPAFELREDFSDTAIAGSSYVLARLSGRHGTFAPGVRVDHSSLTGATSVSPWFESRWRLPSALTVRLAGGVYRQEPDFIQVTGLRGSPLAGARAYHVDVGLEGSVAATVSWQVSMYDREDHDYPWLPDAEFRLVGGRLAAPSFTTRYEATLDGSSRGIELLLRRRTPNGLSGWIAYSGGVTRYRDFYADYDQRHAVNMYGVYRLSDRTSFSARFRAGSNFPVPGYYEPRDERYFVSAFRNRVRVPVYSRLDARANRTFTWSSMRLTFFAEVLNLYARRNVRAAQPGINGTTLQAVGLFDPMFPLIPSAGLLLEF